MKIGIRAEDKSEWERRTPLVPEDMAALRADGLPVVVQASPQRAFKDEEYTRAGIPLQADLSDCDVIIGLKEIPSDRLAPDKTYIFFSHVIKGQPYNMPMLKRLMALGDTLIDYERIVDDQGRRLIAFGQYAGLAGMINGLWQNFLIGPPGFKRKQAVRAVFELIDSIYPEHGDEAASTT